MSRPPSVPRPVSAADRRRNLKSRSVLAGQAAAAAAEVEIALAPRADPSAAAFFDVDNTIMQGASIFHLARGLYRRDFFSARDLAGAVWQQAYFRISGIEDPEHIAKARSSGSSAVHFEVRQGFESLDPMPYLKNQKQLDLSAVHALDPMSDGVLKHGERGDLCNESFSRSYADFSTGTRVDAGGCFSRYG